MKKTELKGKLVAVLLIALIVTSVFIGAVSAGDSVASSNHESDNLVIPEGNCCSESATRDAVTSNLNLSERIDELLDEGKLPFLIFYADWCGFCEKQKPIIEELEKEYADEVEFIWRNVEEYREEAQEFGVRGYPTMFLICGKDDGGYLYKRFGGYTGKDVLAEELDRVIETETIDDVRIMSFGEGQRKSGLDYLSYGNLSDFNFSITQVNLTSEEFLKKISNNSESLELYHRANELGYTKINGSQKIIVNNGTVAFVGILTSQDSDNEISLVKFSSDYSINPYLIKLENTSVTVIDNNGSETYDLDVLSQSSSQSFIRPKMLAFGACIAGFESVPDPIEYAKDIIISGVCAEACKICGLTLEVAPLNPACYICAPCFGSKIGKTARCCLDAYDCNFPDEICKMVKKDPYLENDVCYYDPATSSSEDCCGYGNQADLSVCKRQCIGDMYEEGKPICKKEDGKIVAECKVLSSTPADEYCQKKGYEKGQCGEPSPENMCGDDEKEYNKDSFDGGLWCWSCCKISEGAECDSDSECCFGDCVPSCIGDTKYCCPKGQVWSGTQCVDYCICHDDSECPPHCYVCDGYKCVVDNTKDKGEGKCCGDGYFFEGSHACCDNTDCDIDNGYACSNHKCLLVDTKICTDDSQCISQNCASCEGVPEKRCCPVGMKWNGAECVESCTSCPDMCYPSNINYRLFDGYPYSYGRGYDGANCPKNHNSVIDLDGDDNYDCCYLKEKCDIGQCFDGKCPSEDEKRGCEEFVVTGPLFSESGGNTSGMECHEGVQLSGKPDNTWGHLKCPAGMICYTFDRNIFYSTCKECECGCDTPLFPNRCKKDCGVPDGVCHESRCGPDALPKFDTYDQIRHNRTYTERYIESCKPSSDEYMRKYYDYEFCRSGSWTEEPEKVNENLWNAEIKTYDMDCYDGGDTKVEMYRLKAGCNPPIPDNFWMCGQYGSRPRCYNPEVYECCAGSDLVKKDQDGDGIQDHMCCIDGIEGRWCVGDAPTDSQKVIDFAGKNIMEDEQNCGGCGSKCTKWEEGACYEYEVDQNFRCGGETPQCCNGVCTGPKPDLLVKDISFYPEILIDGNSEMVYVTVERMDEFYSEGILTDNVTVELYVDGILKDNTTNTILPDSSQAVILFWNANVSAGEHEVRIAIDTNDTVDECNEKNNNQTKTITVHRKTDLTFNDYTGEIGGIKHSEDSNAWTYNAYTVVWPDSYPISLGCAFSDNSISCWAHQDHKGTRRDSTLWKNVIGPAKLEFEWSGDRYGGTCTSRFYIDGEKKREKVGSFSSESHTYQIPEGVHTIKWWIGNCNSPKGTSGRFSVNPVINPVPPLLWSSSGNKTIYIKLPKNANVENAVFDLTGPTVDEPTGSFTKSLSCSCEGTYEHKSCSCSDSYSFEPEGSGPKRATYTITTGNCAQSWTTDSGEAKQQIICHRDEGDVTYERIYVGGFDVPDEETKNQICGKTIDIECDSIDLKSSCSVTNYCGPSGCYPGSCNSLTADFDVSYEVQCPSNPSLDVGNDGIEEWSHEGEFTGTETVPDFSEENMNYLETCTPDTSGYCTVPLTFHSDSPGQIKISGINVNYKLQCDTYIPSLNTSCRDCCDYPACSATKKETIYPKGEVVINTKYGYAEGYLRDTSSPYHSYPPSWNAYYTAICHKRDAQNEYIIFNKNQLSCYEVGCDWGISTCRVICEPPRIQETLVLDCDKLELESYCSASQTSAVNREVKCFINIDSVIQILPPQYVKIGCTKNQQCDDNNPETEDKCGNNMCMHRRSGEEWVITDVKNITSGDNIALITTLHNIGNTPTNQFITALSVDDIPQAYNITSLTAGKSQEITFNWTATLGEHNLTITADSLPVPDGIIPESMESNNQVSINVNVSGKGNTSPVLSYVFEAGYFFDGVEPDTGDASTIFEYRIKYMDYDNHSPASGHPTLWIDINGDGDYNDVINGFAEGNFTMTEVDSSDCTYTDGKLYSYNTTLPAGENITYKFEAVDETGRNATGDTGVNKGPYVTSSESEGFIFDTGKPANPYPSIMGIHNGTIKPNQTITVQKLYTYPCAGTGGHTEHVRIWNGTWAGEEAYWKGYQGDWHNITFDDPFTLFAEKTYYYEMRTGSYPQIIHNQTHTTLDGSFINCTSFVDANGHTYKDWVPAIRLWS